MEKVAWFGLAFHILFKLRKETFNLKKSHISYIVAFPFFQVFQKSEIAGLCNCLPVSKESERLSGVLEPANHGFGFISKRPHLASNAKESNRAQSIIPQILPMKWPSEIVLGYPSEADQKGKYTYKKPGHKIKVNGTTFDVCGKGWRRMLSFLRTRAGRILYNSNHKQDSSKQ